MHHHHYGEAVPEPRNPTDAYATLGVGVAEVSVIHGHYATTSAGRMFLCALALGVVVRVAARMPRGCRERQALAKAAAELREVV